MSTNALFRILVAYVGIQGLASFATTSYRAHDEATRIGG